MISQSSDLPINGAVGLRSELPQVMIHMKVGMAHAFGSRKLAKRCVGAEFAGEATERVE